MSLVFYDETGNNPLPAGIEVTIDSIAGAYVGEAFTQPEGIVVAPAAVNGTFIASFIGTQAPAVSTMFTTDQNGNGAAVVTGYRSPSLSQVGYAIELANVLPTGPGWYSDASKAPDGNVWPLLLAGGALLNQLDTQTQIAISMMRLQSSMNTVLDSWAYDFFGPQWSRLTGETDAQWYSMILAILQTQKCTIAGLQAIINVFWPWIKLQFGTQNNFGEDTTYGGEDTQYGGEDFATILASGGPTSPSLALGDDTFGGEDDGLHFEDAPGPTSLPPVPIVFDRQSNPTLANLLGIAPPKFGVYLQYPGFSDNLIRQILSPSPLLTTLVDAWKAAGTEPIYCANR